MNFSVASVGYSQQWLYSATVHVILPALRVSFWHTPTNTSKPSQLPETRFKSRTPVWERFFGNRL